VTAAEITDSGRLRSDDESPIEPDVDRACLTAVGRPRHYALCHWLQAFCLTLPRAAFQTCWSSPCSKRGARWQRITTLHGLGAGLTLARGDVLTP
jgi:hypothetical protein